MAMIGMSIGASFALAMVLGPVLNAWIGVPGIFWLTAVLSIGGIAVVVLIVPTPAVSRLHRDAETVPEQFTSVLRDPQLLRLDLGIFALHLILTASFVVLPLALRDVAGLPAERHWELYLPVLVLSLPMAIPFILQAEKHRRMKQMFVGAIAVIALAEGGLSLFHAQVLSIAFLLFVFYSAFNQLEAILPSLIAKVAPADRKGTAMGVYSSSQFFGAFVGGAVGGWLHGRYGLGAVFLFCCGAALLWLLFAATMENPRYLGTRVLRIGPQDPADAQQLARRITAVRGVAEAVVIPEDEVAYLKIDQQILDEGALRTFAVPVAE